MIQRRTVAILGGLVLALAMLFSALRAADVVGGIGDPDDPVDDNACFEGGTLWRENGDGCPTEWYWKAGWYLQRVETGEIKVEDVPDEFQSAMPPQEVKPPVITICHESTHHMAAIGVTSLECLSSDGTGTSTVTGGGPPVGKLIVLRTFYPTQVTCLDGFSSAPISPLFISSIGFTPEELTQLGLQNSWYCSAFVFLLDDLQNPTALPFVGTRCQGFAQGDTQEVVDHFFRGAPVRIIALNLNGFAITPNERSIVATQNIPALSSGQELRGTYTLNGGSTAEIGWICP